jgi:hypothetical protein
MAAQKTAWNARQDAHLDLVTHEGSPLSQMRAELFITAQEELELLDELEALVPAESSPHRSPSRDTRKAVLTKGILSHTWLEGIGFR